MGIDPGNMVNKKDYNEIMMLCMCLDSGISPFFI
jgi:hypothetical protein